MVFVTLDDFLSKAKKLPRLSREEEKALGLRKAAGDAAAKEALIQGFLPFVAGKVEQAPKQVQTMNTLFQCLDELEKAVEAFDFLQEGEPFIHCLSRRMRHCITRCLADRL
ncbi:MAG: hypothetical protein IKD06_03010 [Clostridia bacterium]|nr:hypothetical protein [Clostridia bacterium]